MRSAYAGAFLCGALLMPTSVQSKVRMDKLAVAAQPYVEAALNTPMDALTANVFKDPKARDLAALGLAMFAGRRQTEDGEGIFYAQRLETMEARLLPLSDAYVETHPGVDFRKVDWFSVLKPSSDELQVAVYYQRHYSADYWFGEALSQRNMLINTGRVNAFGTGANPGGSSGAHPGGGGGIALNRGDYVLNREVLLTAAACIRAVRDTVGSKYQGPYDALPTTVFLIRKFPLLDIDSSLAQDQTRSVKVNGYPVGAEACGATEKFTSYVAALRSVTKP